MLAADIVGSLLLGLAIAVVLAVIFGVITRRRRNADGVDSFRRQIDALSPEARRTTVEQLNIEQVDKPDADDDQPGDD